METPELDGDLLRLSWSLLLPFMFYFHKFPLSQVGGGGVATVPSQEMINHQ